MELLEPEETIIIETNSGLLYSKKCVVTNIVLCILILALIINGIVVDTLSIYQGQSVYEFDGIFQEEAQGYFKCGWGVYHARFEEGDDVYSSGLRTWYYGHTECLRLGHGSDRTQYSCDWYKIPNESGLVWCICNICGSMAIFMTLLVYITCLCSKKMSQMFYSNRRVFKITISLCVISGLCVLTGVIYWIISNEKDTGCWTDQYQFVIDTELAGNSDGNGSYFYQFENKQMGISMICDIVALVMIFMWTFFYSLALCQCCTICGESAKYEAKRSQGTDKIVEMLKQQEAEETTEQNKAYSKLNEEPI